MDERPPLMTLPDELLLLCADPRTKRLKLPPYFNRALAGAVLAEFELRGAITIFDNSITTVQPLTLGEPVADRILGALVLDVQLGRPGAKQTRLLGLDTNYSGLSGPAPERPFARRVARARVNMRAVVAAEAPPRGLTQWIQLFSHNLDKDYRESMEARGLLTADRQRVLGLVPWTTWSAAPGAAALAHSRPTGRRGLQLDAIAATVGLVPSAAPAGPIAAAVSVVIENDKRRRD
ncbi:GOLPH3/VPS74 family protein [Streptomyces lushanensis]|uniref:GOLPH3/VPS74 family protein n=1 Tax=Streptomyces lushanensis TaxID=1434255 RepID=UPI00082F7BB4|nr:GPP34 family phosphoprotein [Streptomyces lushanensis]